MNLEYDYTTPVETKKQLEQDLSSLTEWYLNNSSSVSYEENYSERLCAEPQKMKKGLLPQEQLRTKFVSSYQSTFSEYINH